MPFLPRDVVKRTAGTTPASTPAAAARSSARSAPSSTCRAASRAAARADDVEQIVRANCAQGITRFFITDDNFARNKDWEPIFDRLIELREERQASKLSLHHPGRHAVPQDPELHREGRARRRHARLHRAGEHQPGQPDRRQEAAEQDHRIPQDAAGVEAAPASSPMPATSSASRTTRRSRSARDIEIIKKRAADRSARVLLS